MHFRQPNLNQGTSDFRRCFIIELQMQHNFLVVCGRRWRTKKKQLTEEHPHHLHTICSGIKRHTTYQPLLVGFVTQDGT